MSTEWHTYQEAADLLGIKPQSVKKRAIRRHWPRMTGNDGLARVQLPEDALPPVPGPVPTNTTGDIPGDMSPPLDDLIERLRAELATARETVARMEGEAAMNEKRIADLSGDRDRWREMAERLSHREVRPGILSRLFGRRD